MTKTDLSTEALVRREIAEKATPGPWMRPEYFCDVISTHNGLNLLVGSGCNIANASHIAANSPDVAIAAVDELLRLRAELEQYKDSIQSLRYVADNILAECNFRIKENISLKEELLRLREENARMKKEAVCLASGVAVGGRK